MAGSNRAAMRQISRNASWATSSAWAGSRTTRRASPKTRAAWRRTAAAKAPSSPRPQAASRSAEVGRRPTPPPSGGASAGTGADAVHGSDPSRHSLVVRTGHFVRHQDRVDDVDRRVRGRDVAADDRGLAVDREVRSSSPLTVIVSPSRVSCLPTISSGPSWPGDHVVGQDLGQRRLVGEDRVEVLRRDLARTRRRSARTRSGPSAEFSVSTRPALVDRGDQGLEQRVGAGGGGDRVGRHAVEGALAVGRDRPSSRHRRSRRRRRSRRTRTRWATTRWSAWRCCRLGCGVACTVSTAGGETEGQGQSDGRDGPVRSMRALHGGAFPSGDVAVGR